jgi:hypothetical protein
MAKPTVIPLWFGGVTGISNVADLSLVKTVVGIITPSAWTPAIVTVEGSANGVDFFTLYEGRTASRISFHVPPGCIIPIASDLLRCCQAVRLLSGDRSGLIPQVDPREFGLIAEMIGP